MGEGQTAEEKMYTYQQNQCIPPGRELENFTEAAFKFICCCSERTHADAVQRVMERLRNCLCGESFSTPRLNVSSQELLVLETVRNRNRASKQPNRKVRTCP